MLCVALILVPTLAMAGVNPKNGNYFVSFDDITQESGGHELNLSRTYNSKSKLSGNSWFGYGWGSPFETRLMVMPDASVVVHEHGTGQESYYNKVGQAHLMDGVELIVEAAIANDKLGPEAVETLRRQLLTDESLRQAKVLKYGIHTELTKGTVAQSNDCAEASVTRVNDEYQRTTCGEGTDYFDLDGHLIRQENGSYKINIYYAGKYPDRIEDSLGQKILLKWTDAGHIGNAQTDKNQHVTFFTYDDQDNLLISHQLDGNFYKFEYDSNHNMTRIGYSDNTHRDIKYEEGIRAVSVTDADGTNSSYAYRFDPANPSHYWTKTTLTSTTGEQSSREDEFLLTTDASGVEQRARQTSTTDQRKQDILYDEQGRIKSVQEADGKFKKFFYHPTLNKISTVVSDEGSSIFNYDEAGNLIRAYNTQDQLITLDYDSKKHITRMVESNITQHTHRELTFKYNALGKG